MEIVDRLTSGSPKQRDLLCLSRESAPQETRNGEWVRVLEQQESEAAHPPGATRDSAG